MDFEWDSAKELANRKKHRVDFRTAAKVFLDPYVIEFDDLDAAGELRFNAIGLVDGRMLFVTYALRDDVVRIISARGAEPHEKRKYHEISAQSEEAAKNRLARLRRHERRGTSSSRRFGPGCSASDRGAARACSPCADRAGVAQEAEFDAGRVCGAVSPPARDCARLGARCTSSRQGRASIANGHRERSGRSSTRARKLARPMT